MTETTTTTETTKLWAGKYRTPEEMEEAIKGKDSEYQKLVADKKVLENLTKAPEMYIEPAGSEILGDELTQLKTTARLSNLSQDHFNKMVTEIAGKRREEEVKYQEEAKNVGDDKVTLLKEYVESVYPANLRKQALRELVSNKEAREIAFKQRERLLSNRVPGMGESGDGSNTPKKYDGQEDVMNAAKEYFKRPNDKNKKEKLIDLARQVGEARFPDRKRGN